jgi:hypothetical protein
MCAQMAFRFSLPSSDGRGNNRGVFPLISDVQNCYGISVMASPKKHCNVCKVSLTYKYKSVQ